MRKIFFDSSLTIKGMSDGENSMDFPFVETDIDYHHTGNMKIIEKDGKYELALTKTNL